MIGFAWWWVFLLLPLPWLLRRLLPPANREEAALRVPFLDRLRAAAETPRAGVRRPTPARAAALLVWLLLVTAAARPQWTGDPVSLPASGRDLMLAVDISESMKMPDLLWEGEQVTRLEVTRHVVGDFVARRQGDRLGLVLFGTRAYVHVPLTFDRATVRRLLAEARIGLAGESTAIGDAIGLAVKRLRDRPESARVLVLLTDGANTAGEVPPVQAAKLAAAAGVRIYTIGIGAESLTIPGPLGLFGNRQINPSADLDEDTLQEIAALTGGGYFRARSSGELSEIYGLLDELEPVDQDAEVFRPVASLYHWPLGLALLASFAGALGATVHGFSLRRTRPTPSTAEARNG